MTFATSFPRIIANQTPIAVGITVTNHFMGFKALLFNFDGGSAANSQSRNDNVFHAYIKYDYKMRLSKGFIYLNFVQGKIGRWISVFVSHKK